MVNKAILKKIFIAFLLIGILTAAFFLLQKSKQPTSGITIGYIVDLSGTASSLGQESKNGAQMAIDELKAEGKKINISFEDDQYVVDKTITAYHKFVDIDKLKYIVTFGTAGSNAVAPIAQSNQVVQLAISSDPNIMANKFTIKEGSEPSAYAVPLGKEVVRRDYKRIYIIAVKYPALQTWVDSFKQQPDIPSRIIGQKDVDPTESDFRTILTQIKAAKPDSLLLMTLPGTVGVLAKQARELGINVPLFATGVFEDQGAINTSAGALEGQWFVSPAVTQDFIDKYKALYGKVPGREAGNGYDAVMILAQAIEYAGNDAVKANDFLHQMTSFNSKSALGGMDVSNGIFSKKAITKTVQGTSFVPYNP